MPGLIMVLALLLMLPGISRADFQVEAIGKSGRVTSLLVEPTATLLNHTPAAIMFPGSSDATRPGFSMSYAETDSPLLIPLSLAQRFSAAAVDGLAISHRVCLFSKVGLGYLANNAISLAEQTDDTGYVLQLARLYGMGVNVMASEVLSLHFEWERQAPGGIGAGVDLTKADWDPWKEKNMFGAGIRFGF